MDLSLRNDDIAQVDKSRVKPNELNLYLDRLEEKIYIISLQNTVLGKLKVSSDNPVYEPIYINTEEISKEQFEILGKVVWFGRRMG